MERRLMLAAAVMAAVGLAGCNMMKEMTGGGWHTQSVTLTGAHEVPAVSTSASGTGTVTVNSDRTVVANITVSGMTPTAAHIHEGAAGANGPVIVPFVKQGDSTFVAAAGAKMTEAQYDAFKAGRTYVNVHSAAHPSGEIRAQLKGS
jgi:hypothetical protein